MVMLAGVVAAQDEKVDALLQRYDAANESSRRIIAKEFFEELRTLEFVDKMPKIDFKIMNKFCIAKVKELMPELF